MFWVYMGSDEYGSDIFGSYQSLKEAAKVVAKLAVGAFQRDDGVPRRFMIIEANTKAEAIRQMPS